MARRVAVAHPGQLRLIFRAKRKNDRVDARKLAKLLYLDEVPEAYAGGLLRADPLSGRQCRNQPSRPHHPARAGHSAEISRGSRLAKDLDGGTDWKPI